MKRVPLIILLMLPFMFILALALPVLRDSGQRVRIDSTLESTDLSGVEIEGVKIGSPIDDIDLSRFTPNTDVHPDYAYDYEFDEIRINVDGNGNVSRLFGSSFTYSHGMEAVGFRQYSTKINEAASLIGGSFNTYWFDREQGMKANTYVDKDAGISLTVTYSSQPPDGGIMIWAILAAD